MSYSCMAFDLSDSFKVRSRDHPMSKSRLVIGLHSRVA